MPRTLLLADDSVVIQKLVGLSFANVDIELITADNGDTAIELARTHRPDAVIADVIMPGRSGYEVCEALQLDPELRHTPVLLLTGTFEAFDEERARQVGAVGHITKPFEAQALVERVSELFEGRPSTAPFSAPGEVPVAAEPLATRPTPSTDPFDLFEDDLADLTTAARIHEPDPATGDSPSAPQGTDADAVPMPTEISHHELDLDLDLDLDLVDLSLEDELAEAGGGPIGAAAFDPQAADVPPDWLSGGFGEAGSGDEFATPSDPAVAPPTTHPLPQDDTIVPLGPAPQGSGHPSGSDPNASDALLEALPAAVRERLHDTLEKVAWEAFSDLSDQVVRQVLERVEAIAWEVIPQLTETMIRDEIRRLKDDPPSES